MKKQWIVGPFQCNCYLVVCPRTGEAVLVDPGDDASVILRDLEGLKTPSGQPLRVRYLLHTHAHLDHIGATREVREKIENLDKTAPKIALHRADEPLYLNLPMQGQLFGLSLKPPLPIDHFLEHDEELQIGDLKFSVIHTPGHSPGSVCFRLHANPQAGIAETLLSGDTLFQGSVGRTDVWGGDSEAMFKSIRTRILTLDDDTLVCPGHGPETKIGIEKKTNPFLR
ncbi:MBL fold metallo-hydrolase [Bdellovibrionota bacterium FG-1]